MSKSKETIMSRISFLNKMAPKSVVKLNRAELSYKSAKASASYLDRSEPGNAKVFADLEAKRLAYCEAIENMNLIEEALQKNHYILGLLNG